MVYNINTIIHLELEIKIQFCLKCVHIFNRRSIVETLANTQGVKKPSMNRLDIESHWSGDPY